MSVALTEIEEDEVKLEQWLVDQAENGISEIVLIGLFRATRAQLNNLATSPYVGCD